MSFGDLWAILPMTHPHPQCYWFAYCKNKPPKLSLVKHFVHCSVCFRVTGFLMMKIGKMAAVTVGGSIILLQWANHKGYVNINWDKVIDKADKAARSVEASTSKKSNILDKVSELFTGNRPLPTEKCFFYSSKITHPLNSGPLRCEYQKCHVLWCRYILVLCTH